MSIRIILLVLVLTACAQAMNADTLWVRRFQAPNVTGSAATDNVVDPQGNIYVTGHVQSPDLWYGGFLTIKYNTGGDALWTRIYGDTTSVCSGTVGKAIALDLSGNVFVAGEMFCNIVDQYFAFGLVKYNPNGDTIWTRQFMGLAQFQSGQVTGMITGPDGQPCIVGMATDGIEGEVDIFVVKYTVDGDTAWVRKYNGTANGADQANAIAGDSAGNIYIVGTAVDLSQDNNIVTIKYHADGTTAWSRIFNGESNLADYGDDIAVDNAGNVYVSGQTRTTGGGAKMLTLKYTSTGDLEWAGTYGTTAGGFDRGRALTVDDNGNVFVTGHKFAVVKYLPNGDTAWTRKPGSEIVGAAANDIMIDSQGGVIAVGDAAFAGEMGYGYELFVRRFSSDGELSWQRVHHAVTDTSVGYPDRAEVVALAASGDIVVSGITNDFSTLAMTTLRLRPITASGDADGNGIITISDAVYIINYIFSSGPAPQPPLAADADCNGIITISDAVYLINYIFSGGPAPC